MKIKVLLALTAIFFSSFLNAAAPSWTVNPASFQYNMTMVAVANINCTELQNPSNRIGVFVGSQCRGTALTNQVANGRYTASLFIYSNLVSGDTITFKVYNAIQDSIYNTSLSIRFQQNSTFGTSASPFIVLNNNAPTDLSLSVGSFSENTSVNGTIGSLSATDLDASEVFSYSLVTGNGSADNSKFSITGNLLKLATVVDFESQPTCSLRLRVSDNRGCTFDKNIVLSVLNINESPYAILLSDSTISENSPALTVFASLSGLDPDASDNLSYSLVSGTGSTDNAAFNIQGTNLRTVQSFNYELKSTYSIRVRVRDNVNNTFERQITILVTDQNDNPTNILINGSSVSASFTENRTIGSIAAILSTVDEDASNQFIYTFINSGGNDNASFQIVGNQLRTNALFDFENRQVYSVFVQSNDGNGAIINKQFLLNVTDSNDAPISIGLSAMNVAENLPVRSFVSRLSTLDPDANQVLFSYSLVAGSGSGGNAGFLISNDSLYTNTSFNFETAPLQSIRVRSVDPIGASVTQVFQIDISDANDIPTDINISSGSVFENQVLNTVVGNFTTIDQDPNNNFIYTLVSGTGATDNAHFNISGASLRTSALFDFETKSTYSIRVRSNDGFGGTFEKVFSISIGNTNDNPSDIILSNSNFSENRAINSLIGNLTTSDQDLGSVFTYSFANVAANDNSAFVINGSSLRTAQSFNFESKSVFYVYVTSNDGNGGIFTKQFQINVTDSNDAPTDIALSSPTISENKPANFFIGGLTTTDEDATATFSYSLLGGIGGQDNSFFTVRNDSLFTAQALDFEVKNTFNIRLRSTDNGNLSFTKNFVIRVVNDNDAPTDLVLSNNSFNEGSSFNTIIGSFSSLDPDTGNIFTYSLVAGIGSTNNSMFTITGNQLRSFANFNFEAQKQFSIRVQTNDGNGGTFTKVFTINLIDINDIPTNISLSNATIKENRLLNSLIATISSTDEDTLSSFTYSFSNSQANDNANFLISGNQLRSNAVFDYETKSVFVVVLQTNDGNGGVFEKQLVISVLDSNDLPTNISLNNDKIDENSSIGTLVAVLSTEDPDQISSFTYSLVNGIGAAGNAQFFIRNDSLFSNSIFNFENLSTYSIRIKTQDQGLLAFEKVFSISVIDKNDAPTDLLLSENSLSENLPAKTIIGLFSSIDADASNSFNYSLVNGLGSTDNALFSISAGQLRTNQAFNYESKNLYSIRVRTSDGRGGSFENTFTINILDSNDAPSTINLSNSLIAENRQVGSLIGFLSTTDEDTNDPASFTFFEGPNNNNNQFLIINNQLRTNAVFNYESKNFYLVYIHATDQKGAAIIRQFVININDSVDAPTGILLSKTSIKENLPSKTLIGIFNSEDADQISGFTYSLVGGSGSTNNAQFDISNDSLYSFDVFNFENKESYQIRVKTLDNTSAFFEQSFNIQIEDANDAPTSIEIANLSIQENSNIETFIDSITSLDEDVSDRFTYRFTSGQGSNDNSLFKIVDNRLVSNFSFDYETKNTYSIRIATKDKGGLEFEKSFLISITNVNESPEISIDTFFISENAKINSVVGDVIAKDVDAGQTLKYSLVENSDLFLIENNGRILVKSELDYEKQSSHLLLIKVEDLQNPSLSATAQILVKIEDEIETNASLPVSNVITPNGDGVNDYFVIENVELYKDYSLSIYNTNGIEVFKVLNNYDNSWKADYEGSQLPKGVYFYVFKNSLTGAEFKGSINLIN